MRHRHPDRPPFTREELVTLGVVFGVTLVLVCWFIAGAVGIIGR